MNNRYDGDHGMYEDANTAGNQPPHLLLEDLCLIHRLPLNKPDPCLLQPGWMV